MSVRRVVFVRHNPDGWQSARGSEIKREVLVVRRGRRAGAAHRVRVAHEEISIAPRRQSPAHTDHALNRCQLLDLFIRPPTALDEVYVCTQSFTERWRHRAEISQAFEQQVAIDSPEPVNE